ncbi:MAG TPA: FAD-binding oxidoreductase [Acidisoma sp.]|nr:FAD-binding oxidoreductase [Acidisoma sp.]
MERKNAAVIVIGGGVTGLSAAWWLARSGVDVLVIDKGIVGWEASGRNGGGCTHYQSPLFHEEQRLWPQMDELLGYPTEYRRERVIMALTEGQLAQYRDHGDICAAMGYDYEVLDPKQVRDLVPFAGDNVVGAVHYHFGGQANPQRTVQAYAWALQDLGGRILQHTAVSSIIVEGSKVKGVETSLGRFNCDHLVLAAGPQTGALLETIGVYLPVAPARAEMIVTEPLPLMKIGGVDGNGLYGRQTLRGNLAYGGGPHEWLADTPSDGRPPEGGPITRPATQLLQNLSKRLVELFPKAAHVRVIRSWAGIIENTPDGRPVIDRLSEPDNLTVTTMSSVGFGLSPATGHAIRDLVLDGQCSFAEIGKLGLGRFANLPRDWRVRQGWVPPILRDYESEHATVAQA